ncbi:hypothetical protein AMTRI_Chr13g118690 [Amborella trichopoda]
MSSMSMYFISGLTKVNDMSQIMVVYGDCNTIVQWWGVPEDIVSDHDVHFIGWYWQHLFKLMGMKLNFSTSNHPQTDGHLERVNAIQNEYLWHNVTANHNNWVNLLDLTQFCYNLHCSSWTRKNTLQLARGWQSMVPHDVVL